MTDGGQPRRIDVPVEVPEGVNPETAYPAGTLQAQYSYSVSSGGVGYGVGAVKRRSGNLRPMATPAPPPNNAPLVNSVSAAVREEVEADAVKLKTIEEQRLDDRRQKLHRAVFVVVERLRKREPLTAVDEAGFIRNGKAEVQVWVTEKSPEVLAKLKELGFEVLLDAKSAKLIIGRLSIDKLEALADLKFVRYVAPQASK